MIPVEAIQPIIEVLKGCNLHLYGSVLIFTDKNGEMIGEIHMERQVFALYEDYSYYQHVEKELKERGITLDQSGMIRRETDRKVLELELQDKHQLEMEKRNNS
jgi:hypothetical protein